jgi:hypothetical protein
MMTLSGLRRERAIIAVLRTGRIPGHNVTQSEFCDLVRAAARVRRTPGGFPRGWSKASIMNAASKIRGSPAMLCERCKTEMDLRRFSGEALGHSAAIFSNCTGLVNSRAE